MIELNEEDLLSRLKNTEDNTVERKVASDYRDCLKTAVGFSNSLPVGDPAIIFVGVNDKGEPQDNLNLDKLQKDVSKELNKIYPPIAAQMLVRKEGGKEFLAVIVRGSENRPHFAGQSYIRDGSQTIVASREQFERLIAERNSKAREILQWIDKKITFRTPASQTLSVGGSAIVGNRDHTARVVGCNQFCLSITFSENTTPLSYPLDFVEISYDHDRNCLKLLAFNH